MKPAYLSVSQQHSSISISRNLKYYLLLLSCLQTFNGTKAYTISGRYCKQNVSVKYQVSVMREIQPVRRSLQLKYETDNAQTISKDTENYLTYEPRVRWETKSICCPGYRALFFGFCEPICDSACPRFSYCATPNRCECLPGYSEHHPNNKQEQLLDCRPFCEDGCPPHSYCVARNRCECRQGFSDTSKWWFLPLKCERIRCAAPDQRYDVKQGLCVKIEMSMEELMRKVAERLSKGLNDSVSLGSDEEEDQDEEINEILPETTLGTRNEE
uniref:von Willebrand factor D and EGF domain-containing protein n=1 Tax=Ceratitis capitata TaxID=7213 RepID=W8BQZ1_CERCA